MKKNETKLNSGHNSGHDSGEGSQEVLSAEVPSTFDLAADLGIFSSRRHALLVSGCKGVERSKFSAGFYHITGHFLLEKDKSDLVLSAPVYESSLAARQTVADGVLVDLPGGTVPRADLTLWHVARDFPDETLASLEKGGISLPLRIPAAALSQLQKRAAVFAPARALTRLLHDDRGALGMLRTGGGNGEAVYIIAVVWALYGTEIDVGPLDVDSHWRWAEEVAEKARSFPATTLGLRVAEDLETVLGLAHYVGEYTLGRSPDKSAAALAMMDGAMQLAGGPAVKRDEPKSPYLRELHCAYAALRSGRRKK